MEFTFFFFAVLWQNLHFVNNLSQKSRILHDFLIKMVYFTWSFEETCIFSQSFNVNGVLWQKGYFFAAILLQKCYFCHNSLMEIASSPAILWLKSHFFCDSLTKMEFFSATLGKLFGFSVIHLRNLLNLAQFVFMFLSYLIHHCDLPPPPPLKMSSNFNAYLYWYND